MEQREDDLLSKVRKGDTEAFGILYDAHIKEIYTFIYYKTFHEDVAEDLTSITFTKALENIKSYKAVEGASFKSWLYRIAKNTVTDYYRTKKETTDIEDVWDLHGTDTLAKSIENKIALEDVRTSMSKLKAHERDIILMRVWQELSYKEIGLILGKSEESCKMSFSRALKTLRSSLPVSALILLLLHL